ncbi:MAG: hypothetical protein ABSG68_26965 [Thermoguttaceae bacterium]|jgi:hypothetical protein
MRIAFWKREEETDHHEPHESRESGAALAGPAAPDSTNIISAPNCAQSQAGRRLSEVVTQFLARLAELGRSPRTISDYRSALWLLFEHLGADPAIEALPKNLPTRFTAWLRSTAAAPWQPGTLPGGFAPAEVARFLETPSTPQTRRKGGKREPHTIGHQLRGCMPVFKLLGLDCEIPQKIAPNLALPPAAVPDRHQIGQWWTTVLWSSRSTVAAGLRRRVVLAQAIVVLVGLRLGELLRARAGDVEGNWLLVRQSKTNRPRIVYLCPAALGLVRALHEPAADERDLLAGRRLFAERLIGWPFSRSAWLDLVRESGLREKRPHQAMRQYCCTRLFNINPTAEATQLGHGIGVVPKYYLDVLRLLPDIMRDWHWPAITMRAKGRRFAWPERIAAGDEHPRRLYREFRRIVMA